jgi:hypothetical protein
MTERFPTSRPKSSADWLSLQIATRAALARRNPSSLLHWALAYRFFAGAPMQMLPLLVDLYQDNHSHVVIQKSAQVGVSEYLVNAALFAADTLLGKRGNALYVMPTQGQMDDFSQARVDKAIRESPHLTRRLHPAPPQRGVGRLQLKRIGDGYVYFRGADSRRQLSAVDADAVLLDEFDLMKPDVLELASKRLASSRQPLMRVASTPRLPEAGINELFLQSDQRHYYLQCSACGLRQRLTWEENVDQEGFAVVCARHRCRDPLDLLEPGSWIAQAPGNSDLHGYHISRLYSPRADLRRMVAASQSAALHGLQEFYNSDLGEPYVPPGGQITLDVLDRCRRPYRMPGVAEKTYMGIDVGSKLHVVIRERVSQTESRAVFIDTATFQDLQGLMTRYGVLRCVIDGLPEQFGALQFASSDHAKVWLAYYDRNTGDHQWDPGSGGKSNVVHVNRTAALDELFQQFIGQRWQLPDDARHAGGGDAPLGHYYRQVLALKKRISQDAARSWVARYSDDGKPDHYAHAEVYALLALKAPTIGGQFGRVRFA